MPTFKRLKVAGSKTVHIGVDGRDGDYSTLCGKTIDPSRKRVSVQKISEYSGDECELCRKAADGKWESVGRQILGGGPDIPGAIKFPRGTKERQPLLQKKA